MAEAHLASAAGLELAHSLPQILQSRPQCASGSQVGTFGRQADWHLDRSHTCVQEKKLSNSVFRHCSGMIWTSFRMEMPTQMQSKAARLQWASRGKDVIARAHPLDVLIALLSRRSKMFSRGWGDEEFLASLWGQSPTPIRPAPLRSTGTSRVSMPERTTRRHVCLATRFTPQ